MHRPNLQVLKVALLSKTILIRNGFSTFLRCFDIAKNASDSASMVPEYRSKYKEISDLCRKTSVDILDQCRSTSEVTLLLTEHAGSARYFRNLDMISHPRLRMAVEHHHKDFTAHMFCQQMLRQQFHGKVPWHGKPWTYKLIYCLIQIILTPIHLCSVYVFQPGRDIKILRGGSLPSVSSATSRVEKIYYKCLEFSNSIVLNMDAPLNRLISYIGYYFLFICLLFHIILKPMSAMDDLLWNYVLLMAFVLSFLIGDLHLLFFRKSLKSLLNFWRIFDLISHLIMFACICQKLAMVHRYPCSYNPDLLATVCDPEIIEERIHMDYTSSVLFAVSVVQASSKVFYFLQLNDSIGAIIMTLRRVYIDVLSFVLLFALVVVTFSVGLVFITTMSPYSVSYLPLNSSDLENSKY